MFDPITLIVGPVISILLNLLVDKTVPGFTIKDFFKKAKLDIVRLQELENLLLTVDKVVGDAEEKQITNHSVRRWVNNLRDVAYDAEDVLDAIATEEIRSQQSKDQTAVKDFNKRLEDVLEKLEFIVKQIHVLGLKEGHTHTGRSFQSLPTTSLVDNSSAKRCLRYKEKEDILKFLIPDASRTTGKEVPVVSIVGLLSRIGKTTLAQFLYNDEEVQKHFDLRLWVYVSEEFDVFKVTKTIYESATLGRRKSVALGKRKRGSDNEASDVLSAERNNSESDGEDSDGEDSAGGESAKSATLWHSGIEDLDVLQVTLERKLIGKKYLLVLDNVSNVSSRQWDLLRKPLQQSQCYGSRIIVTTCSHNVSSTVRSDFVCDLKPLSADECQCFFKEQASKYDDGDQILKKFDEVIVKKCGGLPLAMETLAGLLQSKLEAEEWENILNARIWDLPDDKSDILPTLRLSYHNLPSQLKQCFAYCSIFPKGQTFKKLDLVRMWIAEGLVQQPNSGRTTLEVGLQYFDELISRSIFQRSSDDRFIILDLMDDLAQHIAGEFFFNIEHDSHPRYAARVRHLSCKLKPGYNQDSLFSPFYGRNNGLRTFLSFKSETDGACTFSPTVFDTLFPKTSCLRVLSLSPYGSSITKCPDSVS